MCCTDIASVYTSKVPSCGQPHYTESVASRGGQYVRGMSVPGDGRQIYGEDCYGIPLYHNYGQEDYRGVPQCYSHSGEDGRGIPQYHSHGGLPPHCGHTAEDFRGVPQHYRHQSGEVHHGAPQHYRGDHRGVPQHCCHSAVCDHESPIL